MSIVIFPAQDGTFIIERDTTTNPPRVIRLPVIGWTHVQGSLAYPICAMAQNGLTHGKAVLHPRGHVTDPTHALVFENETEWLAFIKKAKTTSKDRAEAMPESAEAPSGAIRFGTKSYKTNSYWSIRSANAIFQVDGGDPYPTDDACEKVTRTEFMDLKRDGATVIDPLSGEVGEVGDDGDDDEVGNGGDDDDEVGNDGMDLV